MISRKLFAVAILCCLARVANADIFWYTDNSAIAPQVRSFDSATSTLGAPVTIAAGPLVDPTYAITSPFGCDALPTSSGVGTRFIYADTPFVCVVDTDPASATFNQVIQTINMKDVSDPTDTPNILFCKFFPGGARIYASGLGSSGAGTLPSIRVAKQQPDFSYKFDPVLFPGDLVNNAPGGEWDSPPLNSAPFIHVAGSFEHEPFGIDVSPDGSKLYFACHTESSSGGGTHHSNLHIMKLDGSGDYSGNGDVAEPPNFVWPFLVECSPNTGPFSSGGSRAYVSCSKEVDFSPPDPPIFTKASWPPGPSVFVANTAADANDHYVEAGGPPPNTDPAAPVTPLTSAFSYPVGIAWLSSGSQAFVADRDQSVVAPATDGIIIGAVTPGDSTTHDKVFLWFTDPSAPVDTDPIYYGIAVDNDDNEIVACDRSTAPRLDVYDLTGVRTGFVLLPATAVPAFISCQSGTGSGGGGGGGGGGSSSGFVGPGGSGGSGNIGGGSGGHHKRCGLVGLEFPALFALVAFLKSKARRARKA